MDIFAFAEEGMKIQEEEKQEKLAEEQLEKESKSFKLDINVLLSKIAQKEYGWLGKDDTYTKDEKMKGLNPFILNLWMSMIAPVNKNKNITDEDKGYFYILSKVNSELNTNIFSASKPMNWLLACTVNPFDLSKFPISFVKKAKRVSETKYDKRVIKYMADELWCSENKIYDMIDANLITKDDMKEIAKDLDTLEEPKNKK